MTGSITYSGQPQVSGSGEYKTVTVSNIAFVGDNTTLTCDSEEKYSFAIVCRRTINESASSPTEILFIVLALFFFVVAIILYVKLQKANRRSNEN